MYLARRLFQLACTVGPLSLRSNLLLAQTTEIPLLHTTLVTRIQLDNATAADG